VVGTRKGYLWILFGISQNVKRSGNAPIGITGLCRELFMSIIIEETEAMSKCANRGD
jgi:hypothetical protein